MKKKKEKSEITNIQHVIKEGNPSIVFSNSWTIQVYFHWHIGLLCDPLHFSNPSHWEISNNFY